ncbi:hypothetical protein DM02DRAFT_160666 [Periconia macrospinosa]|uniref:Uncharacterized protein n=1 Tax=Periconia macrospinosa TaxID=97972 RepID=A0A2V1E2P7_9PLEO|nr:hypothetical protein DM02DRAFT_160666 [Periconia macrospinosa]
MRQVVETQNTILASCLERHHGARRQNTRTSSRLSHSTATSQNSKRSSTVSDTKFDFDSETVNSRAYRQALARRRIKKMVSAPASQLQQSSNEIASVDAVCSLHVVPSVRRSVMEEFEDLVSEVESVFSDSLTTYSSILALYMSEGSSSVDGFVINGIDEDRSSTPTSAIDVKDGKIFVESQCEEARNNFNNLWNGGALPYLDGSDSVIETRNCSLAPAAIEGKVTSPEGIDIEDVNDMSLGPHGKDSEEDGRCKTQISMGRRNSQGAVDDPLGKPATHSESERKHISRRNAANYPEHTSWSEREKNADGNFCQNQHFPRVNPQRVAASSSDEVFPKSTGLGLLIEPSMRLEDDEPISGKTTSDILSEEMSPQASTSHPMDEYEEDGMGEGQSPIPEVVYRTPSQRFSIASARCQL